MVAQTKEGMGGTRHSYGGTGGCKLTTQYNYDFAPNTFTSAVVVITEHKGFDTHKYQKQFAAYLKVLQTAQDDTSACKCFI